MKKTVFTGKLNLNKQTISILNDDQTSLIRGGVGDVGDPGDNFLSVVTCNAGVSHCQQCNTCCKDTFCSKTQ